MSNRKGSAKKRARKPAKKAGRKNPNPPRKKAQRRGEDGSRASAKLTADAYTAFLAVLAETGNVTRAADAIGVTRQAVYTARKQDPRFAAAWDEALELVADMLHDEAVRRAVEGVDEPVFHLGVVCGTVRRYSDTLLSRLLEAHDARFRRRNVQVSLEDDLAARLERAMKRTRGEGEE